MIKIYHGSCWMSTCSCIIQEIETFFEVTEGGNLTTNGFMQMYHLQTQNDPEETWKDLKTCKYAILRCE